MVAVCTLLAAAACGSSSGPTADGGADVDGDAPQATVTIIVVDDDASEPACAPLDACP